MEMLLLTVVGPQQRCDLAVPGDVPMRELMPVLLKRCAQSLPPELKDRDLWELGLGDTIRLRAQRTLLEAGVNDGAILFLREKTWWDRLERSQNASSR
jgi:hypothetical protein